jgi:hypothetical protein
VGALLGFIALVRPTNILMFFILLLYGVKTWDDFKQRVGFFIRKFHLVLIMLAGFILVWMPQFLYWHEVTGQFLFYSYGPHGGKFYWGQPHILETLFSYKKGWFVYVPLMVFAMAGLVLIRKRVSDMFLPLVIIMVTMVYVQSSWWCWWFGGSFGMRAYVELTGILAFPLAASFESLLKNQRNFVRIGSLSLVVFFIFLQQFQTFQYKRNLIHYNGMNKEVYWKSFLRLDYHPDYWGSLSLPDYDLARKGMYVFYISGDKHEDLKEAGEEKGKELVVQRIEADKKLFREVKRYAKRSGISVDEAVQ